ncbi:Uncharacterised protein [uncultured archaeon]|nr:Uncharacterised protein [uncultured archaeon]
MKRSITDFLVPIYGPINAFLKVSEESKKNLERALANEISNREFMLNEIDYTSYVVLSSTVSTLELIYLVNKIV